MSRPASQVSTIRTPIAARIKARQSFWRPSSSAFCNCRRCSRSSASLDGPAASRQPSCSRVSTPSGAVLLSTGSRLTANDSRARSASRSRRRPAGRSRRRTSAPASRATVEPSGLRIVTLLGAGQRHAVADGQAGQLDRRRASGLRAGAAISGTNFDDRASWLSTGFQPLARTTSRPLPTGFSTTAGSPPSNRARTRASPRASGSIRRCFQKRILVKSLNCGAGERGEQGVVEGDLAEHRVPARRALREARATGRRPGSRASTTARGRRPRTGPSRRPRRTCGAWRRSRPLVSPARTTSGVEPGRVERQSGSVGFFATTLTVRLGVSSKTRPR